VDLADFFLRPLPLRHHLDERAFSPEERYPKRANWADFFEQAGYAALTPDCNRGHSLTIDHGWQEVAQTALDFVKRSPRPSRASRARSAGASPPRHYGFGSGSSL
jgi:hypothetical protein